MHKAIRPHLSKIVSVSFRSVFLRLSRKRLTINATTHTFSKRSRKDLSENVCVVALIVYRLRDNRQKHQQRRLNSYRGDYKGYIFLLLLIFLPPCEYCHHSPKYMLP